MRTGEFAWFRNDHDPSPTDQPGPTPTAPLPPPSQTEQNLAIRRTRRSARWDEVRGRRAAGYSIQRIAHEMGMHRRTARRYLATPVPPRNRPSQRPRPTGLRCLCKHSSPGEDRVHRRNLADGGGVAAHAPKRVNVRWLCLRPPGQLDTVERDALQQILEDDEALMKKHSERSASVEASQSLIWSGQF
jgi:hypothetical protein